MAVAHDAATESHTGTTGWTTTPAPFTFAHTPGGTPRGVLLFCFVNANEIGAFVSASYGGVAMTAVPGGEAVDTATEPGRCKAFFLGAGIPTGTQTVSIAHSASANVKYAVVITVSAAGNTEIIGTPVLLQENGTLAEQNVDSGSVAALRYAGINSGLPDVPPAGANSMALHSIDFVARVIGTVRETTAGAGSRPVGFYSVTSDDRAAVHLAICEIIAVEKTAISALEAAKGTLQTRLSPLEALQAATQSRQSSYGTAGGVLQTRLSPLEASSAPVRQAVGIVESLKETKAADESAYETAGTVDAARSVPWEAATNILAERQTVAEALASAEAEEEEAFEALLLAWQDQEAPYEFGAEVAPEAAVPFEAQQMAGVVSQDAVAAIEALGWISAEDLAILNSTGNVAKEGFSLIEAQAHATALVFSAWEALQDLSRGLESFGEAVGQVLRTSMTNYEAKSGVVIGPARRKFTAGSRGELAPEARRIVKALRR